MSNPCNRHVDSICIGTTSYRKTIHHFYPIDEKGQKSIFFSRRNGEAGRRRNAFHCSRCLSIVWIDRCGIDEGRATESR